MYDEIAVHIEAASTLANGAGLGGVAGMLDDVLSELLCEAFDEEQRHARRQGREAFGLDEA